MQNCKSHKHRVIKVIRQFNLEALTRSVNERGGRVLYLVRDPRGILSSRKTIYGKNETKWKPRFENDTLKLCSDFEKNIDFMVSNHKLVDTKMRSNVLMIRYEDFAYAPKKMATKLYKYLNRSLSQNVEAYIDKNTNSNTEGTIWSTKRNSSRTAEAWRSRSTIEDVLYIQKHCSRVLQMLGYTIVTSKFQLKNTKESVVKANVGVNVDFLLNL